MERIGRLLKAYLSRHLSPEDALLAELVQGWGRLSGAGQKSRVHDLRNGVLVVETDHPAWAQLLGLRKGEILEALRTRYRELGIRDIRFTAARPAAPPSEAASPRRDIAAERGSVQCASELEQALGRVADAELRRLLEKLFGEAER